MPDIFDPLVIHGVKFPNRVLRSSVGGRMCNYDGTVTDVWKNFEKCFADGGVGGVISTTFHVDHSRLSPLQYPSIAQPRHMRMLRKYIPQIKEGNGVPYIVQIGDPGYTTYTSLLAEASDGLSSSNGFDFGFGYTNRRIEMTDAQIEQAIENHARAARHVREAGADGVEITAAKGYLIHQFLNPGINTRTDAWGGNAVKRFELLRRIVLAVREAVGDDYLVGVRIAGADHNADPAPIAIGRLPWRAGNGLQQMIDYAQRLESLHADYLHVTAGFGFPNPHDVPGRFPFEEVRMFFDSARHLSGKAQVRAALTHIAPTAWLDALTNIGWKPGTAVNLAYADAIRQRVGIAVIANGGFQTRAMVSAALHRDLSAQTRATASTAPAKGHVHMVSMARALIADPNLVRRFRDGKDLARACTQCNKCVGRTPTSPLGCYDRSRFDSDQEMVDQIIGFNRPDEAHFKA